MVYLINEKIKFTPFLTLKSPKYEKLRILTSRNEYQKYSLHLCAHFAHPIFNTKLKFKKFIFSDFSQLPRPLQPKISILKK